MSTRPVFHALHDIGLATWFGGSLMGATGLNGAASLLDDPRERSRISTRGWSRWAPVNAAGIGAHLIGAGALLINELPRVRTQEGLGRSSAIKTGLTVAGLGVGAWSGALNRKMAAAGAVPVAGATEPGALTPPDVAKTQKQLKLVQWLNPLVSGALVGVTAWQEEQMRSSQQVQGIVKRLPSTLASAPTPLLGAAVGAGLLLALKRRSGKKASMQTAYPVEPAVVAPLATTQTTTVAPATTGTATVASTPTVGSSTVGSSTTPVNGMHSVPVVSPTTPPPSQTGSTTRSFGTDTTSGSGQV